MTPGNQTSEHARVIAIQRVCHAIAAICGVATPIVSFVGTPLAGAVCAALAGTATAVSAWTAAQYSEDRTNVKTNAEIGGQLLTDLKPLLEQLKAQQAKG